ncbi:MAG: cation:proton antiporter [Bryobacterales bacterium]|nr:cation:proton antiporter [Bryobacterales bacterium]
MDSPLFALMLATTGDATKLLLEMFLVFASAKLLAEVAERLRQPPVVGELAAGVLLGPAVLGWVRPNDLLSVLADLGVMFLLFRVGLELRDFRLTKVGANALAVAVVGVVVPFLAGWGLMVALGHPRIEAVFVGAALVATSVGITARVLAAKGLLDHQASKIILAAAIIDDVLGLLVLAVVSSSASGTLNLVELCTTAALAVAFTFLVAQWGTRTMEKIVPKLESRMRSGEGQFTLAMLAVFGLSLLAVYAGVAAIIGAFLAGMALAKSVDHRVHEMTTGVTELLVPFFLVGIGLHLDVTALKDPGMLVLAVAVTALACATKFIGCGLGALRMGWRDATRIGIGMMPRGEVGMVVAQIGLGLGVIAPGIYGVVVLMSIATTVIAPPLLQLAYRDLIRVEAEGQALPRVG